MYNFSIGYLLFFTSMIMMQFTMHFKIIIFFIYIVLRHDTNYNSIEYSNLNLICVDVEVSFFKIKGPAPSKISKLKNKIN